MRPIPIPGLKSNLGLGDLVAEATSAVGISPCGGCKERQKALNHVRLMPYRLPVPEGYTLKAQGQLDGKTQVLLVHQGPAWATLLASEGVGSSRRDFDSETAARQNFTERMRGGRG